MTLADVKTFFRTVIKVVAGGPVVGTPGANRAAGVLDALDKLAEFADSKGAATQHLQLLSPNSTLRAAALYPAGPLTLAPAVLLDNASAVSQQVNVRGSNGIWQPGALQSATDATTTLAAIAQADYDAGNVELQWQLSPLAGSVHYDALAVARVALGGSGLAGLSALPCTRANRRVYNPATSPEPASGLAFNANGPVGQRFYFDNPPLSEATVVFWARRNEAFGTHYEYWFHSCRPATDYYAVSQALQGEQYFVEGTSFANTSLGMPQGAWKRVVLHLSSLAAGQLTLFAPNSTGANTEGPTDIEVYDVRFYSRHLTTQELGDREAAPADSLLGRWELAPGTDPTQPVPDLSGNNRLGTLFGF